MKLVRLALESWRGLESRDVNFADGVTLIEGPNEIGKSTVVEAIRTLFEEMDSSSKKGVKAIQPVGQDVGSRVEVEVITGDYHFVYTKTYNKDKKTELRILAPQPDQLTGREAHERAEQILDETLDRALWNALLVEQGKEIAGAYLADSSGLARALDKAAGTSSGEQDDSALFSAVQAQYEQYFSLKAGKPRYAGQEDELQETRAKVDVAKTALAEVEADSDAHQRASAEVRRLESVLPELQDKLRRHETSWQAIDTIKAQVATKQSELEAARELLLAATEDQQRRQALVQSLADSNSQLAEFRGQLSPQAARVKALKKASSAADTDLKEAKRHLKEARATAELARSDEQHLQNAEELKAVQKQLTKLEKYNKEMALARTVLTGVKIDADGLEKLREAESQLQIAIGKRDTATSSIEIKTEKKLQLSLNEENIELSAGAIEERNIAAELRIAIPGVASIRVVPSQSANELEAEVDEYKATLQGLLKRYSVTDLADAVALEAKRVATERDMALWVEKIDELLEGESEAGWQGNADDLQARCENYITERPAKPAMPASLAKASAATQTVEDLLNECEETVDARQARCDELREEYNEANAEHLVAAQEVTGLEHATQDQKKQLADAQAAEEDKDVDKRVIERAQRKEKLQADFAALNEQLESASPDAAEALLTNARDASQRAERDLRDERTQLAVLEDRLTKAQANGRFEALEAAEHKLETLETRYAATLELAAAARLLWETLSKHRDNARKAYVRPLKDGIEQLGKIVFGADFAVELSDGWELLSRTQADKTIPFDDLSVGAKEQLGILTRLAAARIVSNQGGVPIIIDDALGFSDPSRLETMGAAISSAGKDCQVILLTCTPGRFMHVGSAEVVKF
jgi:uncharacterized protein YhaN